MTSRELSKNTTGVESPPSPRSAIPGCSKRHSMRCLVGDRRRCGSSYASYAASGPAPIRRSTNGPSERPYTSASSRSTTRRVPAQRSPRWRPKQVWTAVTWRPRSYGSPCAIALGCAVRVARRASRSPRHPRRQLEESRALGTIDPRHDRRGFLLERLIPVTGRGARARLSVDAACGVGGRGAGDASCGGRASRQFRPAGIHRRRRGRPSR